MDDQDRYTRITLRLPKNLHKLLQDSADSTSKSMNAEIVARLDQSFEDRPPQTTDSKYVLSAIERLEALLVTAEGKKDLSDQHALSVSAAFMEIYPVVADAVERDDDLKARTSSAINLGLKSVRRFISEYEPQGLDPIMKAATRTQEILAPAFAHLSREEQEQNAIEVSPESSDKARSAQKLLVSRIKEVLETIGTLDSNQ